MHKIFKTILRDYSDWKIAIFFNRNFYKNFQKNRNLKNGSCYRQNSESAFNCYFSYENSHLRPPICLRISDNNNFTNLFSFINLDFSDRTILFVLNLKVRFKKLEKSELHLVFQFSILLLKIGPYFCLLQTRLQITVLPVVL